MRKMKALLDTNIVIHRETPNPRDNSIGTLFKWLDKAGYEKCVHPITVRELNGNSNKRTVYSFKIKLESYTHLQTVAPLHPKVAEVSSEHDSSANDENDTLLLNELYQDRVDLLISEDKKIHWKAGLLEIEDRVFTIDSFLEKVVSEHPDLINYSVLAVKQEFFGNIQLEDPFFDSLRDDYPGFDKWFKKKSEERAYITYNDGRVVSFLYLKVEGPEENYSDITPVFLRKKRLKIGTFKVVSNGVRLGERFVKIIFDNAVVNRVDEIYVTVFKRTEEQRRLISLLEEWGFREFGQKGRDGEFVYVRDLTKQFNLIAPKETYPFIPTTTRIFLVPIYPKYHTELLPDSFLRTESPQDFVENEPHRNAISKIYISRSIQRDITRGDVLIFYRTGTEGQLALYTSVITTIAIVEEKLDNIRSEEEFLRKARKRSIFTDEYLREFWRYNPSYRPFLIRFLSTYSFKLGQRLNRERLLDMGILTGEKNELRGLKEITSKQFCQILKEAQVNECFIVN